MPKTAHKIIQKSVKEMLLENRKQEEPVHQSIKLPPIFSQHADISLYNTAEQPARVYECTEFSQFWFRENSNLEEIVESYWESRGKTKPKISYTAFVIRAVMSDITRRVCDPFCRFRFHSTRAEEIGKLLLINPAIKSSADLREFHKFRNQHRLGLCSVPIEKENEAHKDARNYLAKLKRQQKTKGFPVCTKQRLAAYVLRQRCLREHFDEDIYLLEMSVETIETISNYKSVVARIMRNNNVSEELYQRYAELVLGQFKKNPEMFLGCKELLFHPKYNVICNNIPSYIQEELARDFDKFYNCTNAYSQLKRHQEGSTREAFFELYKNCNDQQKKFFPFHQLYYKGGLGSTPNESIQLNTSVETMEMQHESRIRFERLGADEKEAETVEDITSESSLETVFNKTPRASKSSDSPIPPPTVIRRPVKAPVIPSSSNFQPVAETREKDDEAHLKIPFRYLADIGQRSGQLMELEKILCREKTFVSAVKSELRLKYQKNFEILWKEFKTEILINYIQEKWNDKLVRLIELTENFTANSKQEAQAILMKRVAEQKNEKTRSPGASNHEKLPAATVSNAIATSQPIEKSTEQPNLEEQEGSSVEMMDIENFPLPESVVVIKQEILSKPSEEMEYTDVECLGTLVDKTICISDSEEEDTSLCRDLQLEDSPNMFLREINQDTQPMEDIAETEGMVVGHSDETLRQLKNFETATVRQLINDKQRKMQTALKENAYNQSRPTSSRPGPKCSKKKTTIPGNLQYLDDEDSSSPGNELTSPTLSHVLNDDFNVFLSSQLVIEEPLVTTHTVKEDDIPFTFAKQSSSGTSGSTDPTCFVVNLNRVSFEKNKIFELQMSIPQYSLFNIIARDENVKEILNQNELEYTSLLNLLQLTEKYEYYPGVIRCSRSGKSASDFIIQNLDQFFSTQIKFKTFQLYSDNDTISCSIQTYNSGVNVSNAIDPETLDAIKSHK